jgi:large conductance mechanosensitive channel
MMKKFINEFKEFISRGNVMDMAVGIIIGGAFTSIVSSLVEDIINPVLGLFGGMNLDKMHVNLFGEATLNYGKFITSIINFLLMSLVLFLLIRTVNKAASKFAAKQETEKEINTKTCPYCKSEIDSEASRCPKCTSMLNEI